MFNLCASQGPCCTSSCTLKFGDKCRSDNGCRDAAHCDGKRAVCPASRHKPNRTRCDKELVCFMGVRRQIYILCSFTFKCTNYIMFSLNFLNRLLPCYFYNIDKKSIIYIILLYFKVANVKQNAYVTM